MLNRESGQSGGFNIRLRAGVFSPGMESRPTLHASGLFFQTRARRPSDFPVVPDTANSKGAACDDISSHP